MIVLYYLNKKSTQKTWKKKSVKQDIKVNFGKKSKVWQKIDENLKNLNKVANSNHGTESHNWPEIRFMIGDSLLENICERKMSGKQIQSR